MNCKELHGLIGKFVSMTLRGGSVLEGELMWADSSVAVLAVRGDNVRVCHVADITRCEAVRRTFLTIGNKARYYTALDDAIGYKSKNMDEIDWNKAALCYETAARECGFDDSLLYNYLNTVIGNLQNTGLSGAAEDIVNAKIEIYCRFVDVLGSDVYDIKGLSDFALKKYLLQVAALRLHPFAARLAGEAELRSLSLINRLLEGKVATGIEFDLLILSVGIKAYFSGEEKDKSIKILKEIAPLYEAELQSDPLNRSVEKAVEYINDVLKELGAIETYSDETLGTKEQSLALKCFRCLMFSAMKCADSSGASLDTPVPRKNKLAINKSYESHKKLNKSIAINRFLINNIDWFSRRFDANVVATGIVEESRWQLRLGILNAYALKYCLRKSENIDFEDKRQEYIHNITMMGVLANIDYSKCPKENKLQEFLKYMHCLGMDGEVRAIGESFKNIVTLDTMSRLYICTMFAGYYYEKSGDILESWKYLSVANDIKANITETEKSIFERIYPGVWASLEELSETIGNNGKDVIVEHYRRLLTPLMSYAPNDYAARAACGEEFVKTLDSLLVSDVGDGVYDELKPVIVPLLEEFEYPSEDSLVKKIDKSLSNRLLSGIRDKREKSKAERYRNCKKLYTSSFKAVMDVYRDRNYKDFDKKGIQTNYYKAFSALKFFDPQWGIDLFKEVTDREHGIFYYVRSDYNFRSTVTYLKWNDNADFMKYIFDKVVGANNRKANIQKLPGKNNGQSGPNSGLARFLEFVGDSMAALGCHTDAADAYDSAITLSGIVRRGGDGIYERIENKLNDEKKDFGPANISSVLSLDDLRAMHFPRLTAEFWKMFNSHLKFTIHEGGEHAVAGEEKLNINSFADRVKLMNSQLKKFVNTAVREKKTVPASLIHQIAGFISGKYDEKDVKWLDIDGKQRDEGYGQTNWEECIRDHGNPFSNRDFQKVIVKDFRPSIRFKNEGRRSSVSGVRKFLEEKYPNDVEVVADTASLDFYTNVTLFNDSVKRILGGREDKTAKMKVSIEEINDSAVITFTEHKSETPVIDYDKKIKRRLAGDMGEVAKNCCGYCDLVIETDSHRYNILRSVDNPPAEVEENRTPSGNHYIKFTFTFYI